MHSMGLKVNVHGARGRGGGECHAQVVAQVERGRGRGGWHLHASPCIPMHLHASRWVYGSLWISVDLCGSLDLLDLHGFALPVLACSIPPPPLSMTPPAPHLQAFPCRVWWVRATAWAEAPSCSTCRPPLWRPYEHGRHRGTATSRTWRETYSGGGEGVGGGWGGSGSGGGSKATYSGGGTGGAEYPCKIETPSLLCPCKMKRLPCCPSPLPHAGTWAAPCLTLLPLPAAPCRHVGSSVLDPAAPPLLPHAGTWAAPCLTGSRPPRWPTSCPSCSPPSTWRRSGCRQDGSATCGAR